MLAGAPELCAIDVVTATEVVAADELSGVAVLEVDGGGNILSPAPGQVARVQLDANGCVVLPGFVDQHIHGVDGARCYGHSNASEAADHLERIAASLPRFGVTSFAPTTMAEELERVELVCRASDRLRKLKAPGWARSLGVHLEGPFLAHAACGAHDQARLRFADRAALASLTEAVGDSAVLMTFAPEAADLPLVRAWSHANGVRLSVGHTTRPSSSLDGLVSIGCSRMTHLYNAMGGMNHRAASIALGALLRNDITCELIFDGHLVHRDWLKLAIRMLGPERIVAVSDAIELAGDPPEPEGVFAGTRVQWNGNGYVNSIDGRTWSSGRLLDFVAGYLRFELGLSWTEVALLTAAGVRSGDPAGKSRLATGRALDSVVVRPSDGTVVATLVGGRLAYCAEPERLIPR